MQVIRFVDVSGIIINSFLILIALWYLYKVTKCLKDGIALYLFAIALICRVIVSMSMCSGNDGILEVALFKFGLRIFNGLLTVLSFRILFVAVIDYVKEKTSNDGLVAHLVLFIILIVTVILWILLQPTLSNVRLF